MALDGIFLHLLKNEIKDKLLGCRVDKIHQPSRDELLFSFRTYNGVEKLLLSAKADCPRIQLTKQNIENPKKPPMLTMLLRKYLSSAKLVDILQDGFERILTLVFDARNELGDPVEYRIIIEIMGRHSNIILVDDHDNIIECVKKIDALKSSVREILPGIKYTLPPQQNKMNILADTADYIEKTVDMLEQINIKPSKAYSQVLQGVSPIVCRELDGYMTLSELKEYIFNPTPCVVITDKPKDFTFFVPKQYGELCEIKIFDSFSQLIDYFYYEQVRIDRIRQRSNDLFHYLSVLQERAVRKSINRKNELKDCEDKERLKMYGDLISSNLYRLEKGALFYDLENFYDDNSIVRIPADPKLTPNQNAQKYYKEYRKKQIAQSKLNDFIAQADEEATYLDSVIDSLSRAETDSEITAIKEELFESGYIRKRLTKNNHSKKLRPRKFISSEGYTIYVGRNNIQNDMLTLKSSKNYDLWFHVKDVPGSHTVITAEKGKSFTDKVIRQAAMIAVKFSKASKSSNVAVDYTIIKNVKKTNGAKPGMVIYDSYKTEYVTPNEEELSEVKEIE